jgi:tRNA A37 methylthiotransferase MiaB
LNGGGEIMDKVMVVSAWLSCILNRNMSQRVRAYLEMNGYEISYSPEKSDIIIYSGCGVTEDTELQSHAELRYIVEHADAARGKKIILIGCLPKQNHATRGAHLDKDNQYRELLLDARFSSDLTSDHIIIDNYDYSLLDRIFNPKIPFDAVPFPSDLSHTQGALGLHFSFKAMNHYPVKDRMKIQRNFIQQAQYQDKIIAGGFFYPSVGEFLINYGYSQVYIGQGCKNVCTYCAIKISRDKLVSVPAKTIMERITELAGQGSDKFVLLCQDMGSWGLDIGSHWLELLEQLSSMDIRNLKLALFNVKAEDILENREILDKLVNSGKIGYIAAMNQHINERILGLMKRRVFRREDYLRMINDYGSKGVHIHTYNIIGFPGETESEFEELVSMIGGVETENFSLLNFPYSDRKGTAAYEYDGKIPVQTILERIKIINAAYLEVSRKRFAPLPLDIQENLLGLIELQGEHTFLNQDYFDHLTRYLHD